MNELAKVAPRGGRALLFWSDNRTPHAVLPAKTVRFSVTAWMLDNTVGDATEDVCALPATVTNGVSPKNSKDAILPHEPSEARGDPPTLGSPAARDDEGTAKGPSKMGAFAVKTSGCVFSAHEEAGPEIGVAPVKTPGGVPSAHEEGAPDLGVASIKTSERMPVKEGPSAEGDVIVSSSSDPIQFRVEKDTLKVFTDTTPIVDQSHDCVVLRVGESTATFCAQVLDLRYSKKKHMFSMRLVMPTISLNEAFAMRQLALSLCSGGKTRVRSPLVDDVSRRLLPREQNDRSPAVIVREDFLPAAHFGLHLCPFHAPGMNAKVQKGEKTSLAIAFFAGHLTVD